MSSDLSAPAGARHAPTGGLVGARVVVVNSRDLDHSQAGGAEVYAWHVARGLRDAGASVELLTSRERGQARVVVRDGIRVSRRGGRFGFFAWTAARLLGRHGHVDAIVDASCGLPSFSPMFVGRRTPVVLLVHHVHQQQFSTHFPRPVAVVGRALERLAMPVVYRRCPTVAVSESTREELHRQLGWAGPVVVVENGADLPPQVSGPQPRERSRVVVLGRLVAHKRVDLVLCAVRELQRVHPDLRVDVIGRGPERAALEQLGNRLGIAGAVTFHGFVDESEKSRLLRAARVHVCASDAEGWGQTVIEAAAHGVPTVARAVPGLRDSVRDGVTGWLVPDGPDAVVVRGLVGQLDLVLSGASSADLEGARAGSCRSWAERFDWSRMRSQMCAVVSQELDRPARSARRPRTPRR